MSVIAVYLWGSVLVLWLATVLIGLWPFVTTCQMFWISVFGVDIWWRGQSMETLWGKYLPDSCPRLPMLVWSYHLFWWVWDRRESMPCLCLDVLVLSYPFCQYPIFPPNLALSWWPDIIKFLPATFHCFARWLKGTVREVQAAWSWLSGHSNIT